MYADRYVGFNPPFLGGPQNILSQQSGHRLIKNDVKLLILTAPGERVMRPDVGTNIRRIPFEQFEDENVLEELRDQIAQQLSQHEQRVRLTEIVFGRNPATHTLRVSIYFTLVDEPATNLLVDIGITEQGAR